MGYAILIQRILLIFRLSYPSLLESSDIDGGTVAVLTYLRCILSSVEHPDLIHRVLRYLLALPEEKTNEPTLSRPATLARRRKSETLVRKQDDAHQDHSPGLFSLLDMIMGGLRSDNQQTVTVTLRLLGTILQTRHQYAFPGLIQPSKSMKGSLKRSLSQHDANIDALLYLAERLTEGNDDVSNEPHVQDARMLIESHVCSGDLLWLPTASDAIGTFGKPSNQSGWPQRVEAHEIDPVDPLLQSLIFRLNRFFTNDIETNLALTQTLSVLTSCGHTCLDNWLLGDFAKMEVTDRSGLTASAYPKDVVASNEILPDDDVQAVESQPREPLQAQTLIPESPIFKSLSDLVNLVNDFKSQVEDFGIYLAERKHVFKVGDEIESALKEGPSLATTANGSKAVSPNRLQNPRKVPTITERFLSSDNSVNGSRSSSPRGRPHAASAAASLVGRLSHLRISPSRSPSKESVRDPGSPLRRSSLSSTPSRFPQRPIGPADALHQTIKVPLDPVLADFGSPDAGSSEASSVQSGATESDCGKSQNMMNVTLRQILTNTVILQEFLLELAALVDVRATLFDEIDLT